MLLLWVLLATVTGGLIAVLVASWLAYKVFAHYLHHMVSLSVGVLLSVALLHLLPEAFESGVADAHVLFGLMLASLIGFFVLEKIALLRHSHHHEGDGHHHHHGHDRHEAGRGGVLILIGSSLHNLCDGVLVAAAFLTDPLLGVLTAASIIVHEVPHKLGDFVVLLNAGLGGGGGGGHQLVFSLGRHNRLLRAAAGPGLGAVRIGGCRQQLPLHLGGRPDAADARTGIPGRCGAATAAGGRGRGADLQRDDPDAPRA